MTIGIVTTLFSCNDDRYEELNIDPVNPSDVPAGLLVNAATESLFDQMVNSNVNNNIFRLIAQFWNETTYISETNYNLEGRNINGSIWNELYTDVLYDLKDAKSKIQDDSSLLPEEKANQIATVEFLEVYTWQVLVDTFGNVPYSEALMGIDNPSPAYDDAATIYADLLARLNDALASMDDGFPGFSGDYDVIYNGNVSAWKKFGASLKLKLAIQLADVNPAVANASILEAVNTGVFSSNNDNFTIAYSSTQPTNNPLWDDLVASGRTDFVGANTIINYMNPLNDPRRPIYFDENLGSGIFIGGVYGSATNYNSHSHPGSFVEIPDFPGTLMDYAEIEFILAEAVERGISVGGTAESHYNNGILASMASWGVDATAANAYLAQSSVAYNSAPGTWKEKIGLQAWLALYNRGFEAWQMWRRLDAPTLNVAASSGTPVPMRYTYPVLEKNINSANYNAAVAAMGGSDVLSTKLFWDVN